MLRCRAILCPSLYVWRRGGTATPSFQGIPSRMPGLLRRLQPRLVRRPQLRASAVGPPKPPPPKSSSVVSHRCRHRPRSHKEQRHRGLDTMVYDFGVPQQSHGFACPGTTTRSFAEQSFKCRCILATTRSIAEPSSACLCTQFSPFSGRSPRS